MKIEMSGQELRNFFIHAPQSKIAQYSESIHPVDVLDVLRQYKEDSKDILFRLPEKFIAAIIDEAEAEEKYEILMEFSENRQKNIIEELSSDELTDLLGVLEKEQADNILKKMTAEDARMVRRLLSYDPSTAAGIMATEFISIKEDMTVKETLKYLQKNGEDIGNLYDLYVVDKLDRLQGVVSLNELVTHKFDTLISEISHTKVEGIRFDTDQEEVGHIFEKYGYLTIPVIDGARRLLGIVTFDDVMQILRDETTEDIHRLGGVDEGERIDSTLGESVKSRLPWLIINLVTAILASAVVGLFQGTIEKVVALATVMPIVAGMGGNSGTQSLTIIVRAIGLGELTFKNSKKVFLKELGVGIVNAIAIGILVSILAYIYQKHIVFGFVVGLAMIINMVIANIVGYLVPVTLKKLKVDPALASGIFVTTFTDICGFFSFLGLASLLIKYLV